MSLETFHEDARAIDPINHHHVSAVSSPQHHLHRDIVTLPSSSSPLLLSSSLSIILQQLLRYAILSLLLVLFIFVIYDSMTQHHYIEHMAQSLFDWVSLHPLWGVLVVILVYILGTILFVPGSILTIGTGFAFSRAFQNGDNGSGFAKALALASTAVFLGATLGSICSFLLGRYLFRGLVFRLAAQYPLLQAMDRALEHNGLKIMILLRLSPLIPYNALDYISGVTSISLWHFSLALIGILPGTILFCSIGATASSLSDGTRAAKENNQVRLWGMILGILFALAGISVASYYSKLELDRIILMEEEEASRRDLLNHADDTTDGEEEGHDDYSDDIALEEYLPQRPSSSPSSRFSDSEQASHFDRRQC